MKCGFLAKILIWRFFVSGACCQIRELWNCLGMNSYTVSGINLHSVDLACHSRLQNFLGRLFFSSAVLWLQLYISKAVVNFVHPRSLETFSII